MLTWPVTALGWTTCLVQRAAASQARINEFLDEKTDIVSRQNVRRELQGEIVFDHVSFTYPDTGIQALRDVSFRIPPGQTLAVIGNTGSGKSTLATLLCRLYDVTAGSINIDGVDVRDYALAPCAARSATCRRTCSCSPTPSAATSPSASTSPTRPIRQAARDADVFDNIVAFPEGFDTKVGERGITLSGGQKQRVSIARALIKEPRILILDDSLSAVDTRTEHTILEPAARDGGRTSLIISHRVSPCSSPTTSWCSTTAPWCSRAPTPR